MIAKLPYNGIWAVDFEFQAPPGERPQPLCLVARELRSGRELRIWRDELLSMREPPYPIGPDHLFVAYYGSAELGCHIALGWPMPARILDLYVEFRRHTAGLTVPNGYSLVGALSNFGLDFISAAEKDAMRDLIMAGGSYTPEQQRAILAYCAGDVDGLARLLPVMLPNIDLPRALLRGRYMAAAARIEWNGVPTDTATLSRLRANWDGIKDRLIAAIDADYGVFEGRTFKLDRWKQWLTNNQIPWPLLDSGELDMTDDTFREMARAHPEVAPMRELRYAFSQLRLNDLAVGSDGRNRTLLSAFQAKSGRNQPSNTKFIFGPGVWLRGLIKPEPELAVAYVDYSQQEFGIAAALSGDSNMQEAYSSGDPYLAFAKQAGAVPPDATKESHEKERDLFKSCVLGVQYTMGEESLARRIGKQPIYARELLRKHRETYKKFWAWSGSALDFAMLKGFLPTVFGWRVSVGRDTNPRSLRNFPMQANGAEMLRLACCLATERGIKVCAPIHDALLVEGPAAEINEVVAATQRAMAEASRIVLSGFELRSDAKVVVFPDRYSDKRGLEMWNKVMSLLPPDEVAA